MSQPHTPIRVAIDASPLYGHRTGVAVAADGMLGHFDRRVEPLPFVISGRATPRAGHRRLPIPGMVASHLWSRVRWPGVDRWLGPADLVHGTNYVAPPSRLPTLISVYDVWFLRHPELATPVVGRAGRWLRRAVDAGAWVHVSSQATAHEARRLLATDRVEVIHLGPPTDRAESEPSPVYQPAELASLDDGRPFVLAVGTEERRKGYPDLVRAFDRVAVRRDDIDLVIAGARGDDSAVLDSLIAAGRSTRVHRLGPVTETSKKWLLDRATAMVYPSIDEGFGFPILEANQAGVPLVTRHVGSIPEVAGNAALIVEPDETDEQTIDALAGAIEKIVDDDKLRTTLIEAGRRNVERFSWTRCADQITELYLRMLEGSP